MLFYTTTLKRYQFGSNVGPLAATAPEEMLAAA
jgi:hypothetical protein